MPGRRGDQASGAGRAGLPSCCVTETASSPPVFRVRTEPWIAFRPALDAMLDPLGRAVMARLAPAAGERVLDVGCGCGSTTLALAEAVGPTGRVTGVDASPDMIAAAREATVATGLANVDFVEADAGTHLYEPHAYDVVFSRLGTMFFDEPEAAFTNLRRALSRTGRLGFVCWRSLEENAWTTEPRDAAAAIVPLPPMPDPDAPGPFSQARAERVTTVLTHASFVGVTVDPLDEPLLIGRGDVDEAIEFYLRLLPTGYLMFEPDHHLLDRLRAALRTVLERHLDDDQLRLGSAAWLVTAR